MVLAKVAGFLPKPVDQAQLEGVFSLSPEQLLDMSLMDLSRRGGEILLKQAIAAEIRAYLGRDY